MKDVSKNQSSNALACLAATSAFDRLEKHPAVVLERVGCGAGQTEWFYCETKEDLETCIAQMRAGSMVSFYFDERLKVGPFDDRVCNDILCEIAKSKECVVGALKPGMLQFSVDFVAGRRDLDEFRGELQESDLVMHGPFPGRDNDDVNAITVVLPDKDGVVRGHPY